MISLFSREGAARLPTQIERRGDVEGRATRPPGVKAVIVVVGALIVAAVVSRAEASALLAFGVSFAVIGFAWQSERREHAMRCEALERRLEDQAAMAERERRITVATLASEGAHALSSSIRYFDDLIDCIEQGEGLEEDEPEIGRIEIDRCKKLLAAFRAAGAPERDVTWVGFRFAVDRAMDGARELRGLSRRVTVEVPETIVVRANADDLAVLLSCLLRNAACAALPGGDVGVRIGEDEEGVKLDVWDSGKGIEDQELATMFASLTSLRSDGRGVGLMVAARLARRCGWSIGTLRCDGRTVFRVSIPREDVLDRTAA